MSANVKHHGEGLFKIRFICVLQLIVEQYELHSCTRSAIGFPIGKNTGCLYNPMRRQLDSITGDACVTSLLL